MLLTWPVGPINSGLTEKKHVALASFWTFWAIFLAFQISTTTLPDSDEHCHFELIIWHQDIFISAMKICALVRSFEMVLITIITINVFLLQRFFFNVSSCADGGAEW